MISLDELRAKDITLVSNHVVVFLLFGLLLLGRLDDFLHVVNVVLLVLYDFLVRLDLGFGPVLVCLNLHVFAFDALIILIKLD